MTESTKNIFILNSDTKNNTKMETKFLPLNEVQSTTGKTTKTKKRVRFLGIKRKIQIKTHKTKIKKYL